MLLQVARQPDVAAMRQVIARIRAGGANRDVLRQERQTRRPSASERKKPYVFRYRGEDFVLEMRFRRARVPRERVVRGLKQALRSLDDPDAAS
ncbi:MAG: hypothetical protein D6723_06615 [Acidobacteria bacterium]|nr:MAG: hypothetical protein D6723_06615 [Acidobacteriota bacterium]